MGIYRTNCYIIEVNGNEFIIDPGVGATKWIVDNTTKPVAILNTHGHFDHVWSNKELKEILDIPIYIPKDDEFMLSEDPSSQGTPISQADILVNNDEEFCINGVTIKYIHFPGHTPGCSAILISEHLFTGDFVFKNSIGRVDFPYSNPKDMKKSINKFLNLKEDWKIYPGHGEFTSVKDEQKIIPSWLNMI